MTKDDNNLSHGVWMNAAVVEMINSFFWDPELKECGSNFGFSNSAQMLVLACPCILEARKRICTLNLYTLRVYILMP